MTSSSPSSTTFKPKLRDQEYLELVFEDGEIKAKSQRPKLFSLRTKTIMDLYELEYNEDDFKKSIKNHEGEEEEDTHHHHQVVPDHDDDVKKAKNMIEFIIPPDEQSMVVEKSIGLSFDSFGSTDFTEDSEESKYSSLDDDESDCTRPRVVPARTRKRRSKEVSNTSSETKQRNEIDKKMRTLQNLLPNSHKDDNESLLLEETINYMTSLQHQVQMMTMRNRFVTPSMMLPLVVPHYGVPQFMPPVPGADMLQFLNHPGLIPIQIASMENNCLPQSVPRSCVATYPNHQGVATTYTIDQETLKNLKTP